MKRAFLILSMAALLAACTANNRDHKVSEIETHEQALSTIDIGTDGNAEASELIGLYRAFALDFPEDSLVPVYLVRAADLSITLGETDQALSLLDSVISLYPGYDDRAGCLFLRGYAYECAELYDEAREAYETFITEYPEHYLSADVAKMLPFLGLSPEEMFESIIGAASSQNLTEAL